MSARVNTDLRILAELVEIPRATKAKLAEDLDVNSASVHYAIEKLLRFQLVEEAGEIRLRHSPRAAMTYRLHPRLRGPQ